MLCTIYILFVISTALATNVALSPSTSATAARNPSIFDFPNKDCNIVRLPGKAGKRECSKPKLCHNAGGLCVAFTTSWGSTECQQGVVDGEEVSGYRRERWRSSTMPDTLHSSCAGCGCVRKNVRPYTQRVQKVVKNKPRHTRTRHRGPPSTDQSSSSVDEERTQNRAIPPKPQQVTEPETPQAYRTVPVSLVDQRRTPNREILQVPQTLVQSEDDSHPLLFHNPNHINPNL
jgi:hypothetical protein